MKILFALGLLFLLLVLTQNCSAHCSYCNFQSNTCVQCFQNFLLDTHTNTCLPKSQQSQQSYGDNSQNLSQIYQKIFNRNIHQNVRTPLSSRQSESIHLSTRLLQSSANCLFTDPNNPFVCQVCQQGFFLKETSCDLIPKKCAEFDTVKNICTKCKGDLYLDFNKCVNIHCLLYEYGTQNCLQCDDGYELDDAVDCALKSTKNCAILVNSQCFQCNEGFYLQKNKICEALPPGCLQFNINLKKCINCDQNYMLSLNGTCQKLETFINCRRVEQGKCVQCSSIFYFSQNQTCIAGSPLCKDYSSAGKCSDCYPGYTLNVEMGSCMVSSLFNCKKQTSIGTCLECYQGSFIGSSGQCQIVNPLCKTYDQKSGVCLSCYQGYSLSNGQCKFSVLDINCKTFSYELQKCAECIPRYYYNGQKCAMISGLCKGFSLQTGKCTQCYLGYSLTNGQCQINTKKAIGNCKVQNNNVCIVCADFYYFSQGGNCVQRNPLCRTFNPSNGDCTSCYSGYDVSGRNCVIVWGQTNQNCLQSINLTHCLTCGSGYALNMGKCEKRLQSKNCKTSNSVSGHCLSCYNGYILTNNNCLQLSEVMMAIQGQNSRSPEVQSTNIPSQGNCVQFDNGSCVQCQEGYFLIPNGQCIYFNPLCSSFNLTNGDCFSCISGYRLTDDKTCLQEGLSLHSQHSIDYNDQSNWQGNCLNGKRQSPVNIQTKVVGTCPLNTSFNITLSSYQAFDLPTISKARFSLSNQTQISFSSNNRLNQFYSKQFFWHYPAEHTINGLQMDLELQIIYQSSLDFSKLAVVSLLFKTQAQFQNDDFSDQFFFIGNNNKSNGFTGFSLNQKSKVFHYEGSLTVSPCQQLVDWFVYMNPVPIKIETLNKIKSQLNFRQNKRNVQPSNNRKISLVGGSCNLYGKLN